MVCTRAFKWADSKQASDTFSGMTFNSLDVCRAQRCCLQCSRTEPSEKGLITGKQSCDSVVECDAVGAASRYYDKRLEFLQDRHFIKKYFKSSRWSHITSKFLCNIRLKTKKEARQKGRRVQYMQC